MDSGDRPPNDADDENGSGHDDTASTHDAADSPDPAGDDSRDDRNDVGAGTEPDRDDQRANGTDRADATDQADATDENGDSRGGTESDERSAPAPEPGSRVAGPRPESTGFVEQFWNAQAGPLMWIREVLSSALIVLAIGLVLFAVSGVWPPMVAVESGSMEPNMEKGDLIFVTEPDRFAPDAADNNVGVVTYAKGKEAGYTTFGSYGSVIVYHEPGRYGPPIIHRAHFYVEEGENWYDRADESHLRGESCEEIRNCPAPHDGFITKGDNNPQYDQVDGIAPPVQKSWVTGVARIRVPYLGWIRLLFTGAATLLSTSPGSTLVAAGVSVAATGAHARNGSESAPAR